MRGIELDLGPAAGAAAGRAPEGWAGGVATGPLAAGALTGAVGTIPPVGASGEGGGLSGDVVVGPVGAESVGADCRGEDEDASDHVAGGGLVGPVGTEVGISEVRDG